VEIELEFQTMAYPSASARATICSRSRPGARTVDDEHLGAAELFRHAVGEQARGDVGRSPGGEVDRDLYLPLWGNDGSAPERRREERPRNCTLFFMCKLLVSILGQHFCDLTPAPSRAETMPARITQAKRWRPPPIRLAVSATGIGELLELLERNRFRARTGGRAAFAGLSTRRPWCIS